MRFSERELEDWLFQNPDDLLGCNYDFRWIGRQVSVASGVLDLLGVEFGAPPFAPFVFQDFYLLELKAEPLTSKHIAQVCRYAADIESVLPKDHSTRLIKCLVGPGDVTDSFMYEAAATQVEVYTFDRQISFSGPRFIDMERRDFGQSVNEKMFKRFIKPYYECVFNGKEFHG